MQTIDFSKTNITTTPILAGQEWVGEWEWMDKSHIQINAKGDKACKVYVETKPVFEDLDVYTSFPPTGYTMNANTPLYRVAQIGGRKVRVRVVNTSGEDMTSFWLYSTHGNLAQPNSPLNTTVASDADAAITRSVLMAATEVGVYKNVPSLFDGSLKVAISSPVSSFGELLISENDPLIQATAVYGMTGKMRTVISGTGAAAGAANNEFYATSGTSASSQSTVFTKDAVIYHAGQGLSAMFTARFGTPQNNSIMWAGLTNGTDGVTVGYKNTQFGVFFRHYGQQEIRELTFTVGSGGATNATITLNGTAYTVPLTAGTTVQNAREAANSLTSQVSTWVFTQVDNKVVCRYIAAAAPFGGTFSFSHATAVAAFSTVAAGVAVTEDFIPSYDFSEGDVLDWLDPSKGNVYRIDVQYLGYGDIDIYAEYDEPKQYILIHRIHYANTNTRTNLGNPSFRIGWTSANRGNTTPVTCYGASCAGFVQGKVVYQEQTKSIDYSKTSAGEVPILIVKVGDVFNGKINISPTMVQAISVSTESTKGAVFKLIKNPVITGTPYNFTYVNQTETPLLYDVSSTSYTNGTLIDTYKVGAGGSARINLVDNHIHVNPNDIIMVTGQVTSGAASLLTASLTLEDDLP